MAYLNEHLALSAEARLTFAGRPEKRLFWDSSAFIYRLVTLAERERGGFSGNALLGGSWFQQKVWDEIRRSGERLDLTITEVARPGFAVREEWNPKMDWLIRACLRLPVYGWIGRAKHQLISSKPDENVVYMGNLEQLFLPNLTYDHANLLYFGPVV